MERRTFLGTLAAGWVVATGIGRAAGASPYPRTVPLTEAPPDLVRAALFGINPDATEATQATTYPQSVASGDPSPNGIVLWTRVPVDGATVSWQIAADAGFGTILVEGTAAASAASDYTIKLPVFSGALQPFTQYYYRFITSGVASRTGRFKTLPAPTAKLNKLRLGLIVCQDYSNGYYTALRLLAKENVDYVLHLGDYIYEYLDDGTGGPGGGPVRIVPPYPSGAQYPQGLDDYRHLYQVYRSDPDLQSVHENFAMIQLWDDHEFYNDCHQDYHPDTNTPPNGPETPQPDLRQAANQAWSEHGLADVVFDPNQDWQHSIQVYRSLVFGRLARLVITDERLYRDGPPCGDEELERYETLGCPAQHAADRTMLGAEQKTWFLNEVTTATETWKLWANEVMLAQYILLGLYFDLDAWDGYTAERQSILTAFQNAGVQNLVALTGDAHLFMAGYLKTDYGNAGAPPVGVELVVGAVTSGNYADAGTDIPAPLSSPSIARALNYIPVDSLEPVVLLENSHMKFWNGSEWGYGLLTLTPTTLTCDFRCPSTIKQNHASLKQLVTVTVKAGSPNISLHG